MNAKHRHHDSAPLSSRALFGPDGVQAAGRLPARAHAVHMRYLYDLIARNNEASPHCGWHDDLLAEALGRGQRQQDELLAEALGRGEPTELQGGHELPEVPAEVDDRARRARPR